VSIPLVPVASSHRNIVTSILVATDKHQTLRKFAEPYLIQPTHRDISSARSPIHTRIPFTTLQNGCQRPSRHPWREQPLCAIQTGVAWFVPISPRYGVMYSNTYLGESAVGKVCRAESGHMLEANLHTEFLSIAVCQGNLQYPPSYLESS
jgi:hypothetical protein